MAPVQLFLKNQHCWSHGYDDVGLGRSLLAQKQFSHFLRSECKQYGVDWVEITTDWTTEWTKARDDLIDRVKRKWLGPVEIEFGGAKGLTR